MTDGKHHEVIAEVNSTSQVGELPKVIRLAKLIESGEGGIQISLPTPEQIEAGKRARSEFVGRVLARRAAR